jgi:hypothetical protein
MSFHTDTTLSKYFNFKQAIARQAALAGFMAGGERMESAETPNQDRQDEPYRERSNQGQNSIRCSQEPPDDKREGGQADAAQGSTSGIQRGCLTTAIGFRYSSPELLFPLVLFD